MKSKYIKNDIVEAKVPFDPVIMELLYNQSVEKGKGVSLEEWLTDRISKRLLCEPILTRNYEKVILDSFLKQKDIPIVKKETTNPKNHIYVYKFNAPLDFSPVKNSIL